MKHGKRILSLVLALLLVITAVPMSAMADAVSDELSFTLDDSMVTNVVRATMSVDGDTINVVSESGEQTSSMRVKFKLPDGASVAFADGADTTYATFATANVLEVKNPGVGRLTLPLVLTDSDGVTKTVMLKADFGNKVRYITNCTVAQSGDTLTVASGSATAYVVFDTTGIDGAYVEVENVSRNLLERYVTVGAEAVRFYNPVYDEGYVTVNIKNGDGETVHSYDVNVIFHQGKDADGNYIVNEYTPVLQTLRGTYAIDGDTIKVTANASVTNVYLTFGRYQAETLTASINNNYVKKTGARSWRVMNTGASVEFDVYFDATASGGELVTRHVVVDFSKQTTDAQTGVSATVEVDGNGTVKNEVSMRGETYNATVPAGVAVEDDTLTLSVSAMDSTTGNIVADETDMLQSYDVHIEGVSKENDVAIIVTLGEILPIGMNKGNVVLYHIEDGVTNVMTQVFSLDELDAHNEFYYDPATGIVTVAMATFSEIAVVSDSEKAWQGNYDYEWYNGKTSPYKIANADQLAAFGQIVGGMAEGIDQDSFEGDTVILISDINLNDAETSNDSDRIFYPIGYCNSTLGYEKVSGVTVSSTVYSFEGTFDGNGHTIKNFYQNTWEMFGDYNSGYSGTPNHYKDAMGLFGYVVNGEVKNLTVDNFSSDGEFTPTGVIAAYAVNSTFENIAITNCNPRVYNTGNGGIVGIGGNSDDPDTYRLTFNNITIDNSNKITALWGSWDVACGGLVGMFRGAGHADMTNCHVAAQIDVFNDVCGNYQYYWYRYAGMMIGTNKNMVTDENGYTVPETSKFHAENCTVHFGDWNNYWYCELVENSLASYTHDHQFSRLDRIASVDDIKSGEVWTKTGNFYVEDTETCYHIRKDADGNLYEHKHEDAGYETVNGETILKENNAHIYLPFNQLFTGYGWGVKHIPVYNGEDYAFDGITILDREVADSEVKFEATSIETVNNVDTYTVAEFFTAITGKTINGTGVYVTIDKINETDTVEGTYVADADNWKDGTIEFDGVGEVKITIQDYDYCTPTALRVTVEDKVSVEKFKKKFTNENYLYRVGNANTVTLGTLFEENGEAEIDSANVVVTVASVEGSNATGVHTKNATWTNGTIQFSGTGVVKVSITDNLYCIPTELYLEVVDAKNITTAAGSSGTDVVLLKDVTIASDGTAHYTNCTLYGNGFTFDIRGGMNMYNSKQGHGIIIINGATLDNLVVLGDVYDTYGAYSNQEDYTSAIDATSSVIQNCHISNCSTPIRANGVAVKDTTLYGGTVANMIISGGTNTLENVTTVNYNDGRDVIGWGILIGDGAAETTKLVLNGTLKQYNFLSENDASLIADSTIRNLFNAMFDSGYSKYHFGSNPVYVNPGIISLTSTFDISDITDNTGNGYEGTEVSYNAGIVTATGYLYSIPASENSVDNNYIVENDTHKATVQGDYLPAFNYDLGDQQISYDGESDTRYMYGDANGVEALYQSNEEPITLDLTKLATVSKYSGTEYAVTATCEDPSGNIIGTDTIVTLSASGTYNLIFAVEDNIFYDINGEQINKSVKRTYEVPLILSVKDPEIKDAVITVKSTSIKGTYEEYKPYYVTVEGYYLSFDPLSAITVTDYDANGTGTTVDLTSNISSTNIEYVNTTSYAWAGAKVTITYTDGRVLVYELGATSGLNSPSTSNGGKTITVTNGAVKSDGYIGSTTTGTWPITSYTFKGNSQTTVSSSSGVTVEFTEISSSGGSGCFAEGTLITLADGTKKAVEDITYEDELLAWDFNTGAYAVTTPSLIENHEKDEYKVINLEFEDGTTVRVVVDHGFFDVEENNFVYIDEENVDLYVGHDFVKTTEDGAYATTKLVGYTITTEEISYHTIQTAIYNNCIAEDMFTLTSPPEMLENDGWFDYFEIGEGMKYDEEKMQADIEKYGLYTYEDFAEYVTYEQFIAFNGPYLKVLVGRGVVTYEQIVELISTYVNPAQ